MASFAIIIGVDMVIWLGYSAVLPLEEECLILHIKYTVEEGSLGRNYHQSTKLKLPFIVRYYITNNSRILVLYFCIQVETAIGKCEDR